MRIIIVGAGTIGFYLARRLYADKHNISLVDKDTTVCERVAKDLDILVINGDACNPEYLDMAGIQKADVIAAVTGKDETNLIICQIAKERFGIRRCVARVNDSRNEHTFSELGVDVPIDATEIIAKIIEEEVSFTDFINLMTFKKGKLAIVRVDIPETSPIVNKFVKDIKLPQDSVLVSIIRGESVIIPKGNTRLESRDDIIALTTIENEQYLLKLLVGKL